VEQVRASLEPAARRQPNAAGMVAAQCPIAFRKVQRRAATVSAGQSGTQDLRAGLDPKLLVIFAKRMTSGKLRINGSELSLLVGGDWSYCQSYRTAPRPFFVAVLWRRTSKRDRISRSRILLELRSIACYLQVLRKYAG
jgi:hypothetical protein